MSHDGDFLSLGMATCQKYLTTVCLTTFHKVRVDIPVLFWLLLVAVIQFVSM